TRSQSDRIATTLSNLSDTASFLAGLPGVKTLLYLSHGLDTQPGTALATYATGLCPAGAPELMTGTLAEQMSDAFLELTRHANTRRVTIHALQASGLSGAAVADASRGRQARDSGGRGGLNAYDTVARSSQREGMRLIAEETGGRAVFGRNDLGTDLAQIGGDISSYYSLAFRKPAGGAGTGHRIEVRLPDSSLTTRYRHGYRDKDEDRWLTERIEGALQLGIIDNALEVRLGAGTVQPAADGLLRLPVHVMVPVDHLVFEPHGDSMVATVTARILARSLETGALSMRDKNFRVRGAPGATGFADLVIDLELAAGNYLTAIGVREDSSRVASFVSTTVAVAPTP
ncbi:MAG: hypothetical protein OES47_13455, partial [Acidobacteriota bacterium]|nr:hypothetical protein [Acidobacteriota bacterium]